jgi:hypothetical protein
MEQPLYSQRKCRIGCSNYNTRLECCTYGVSEAYRGKPTKPGKVCHHPELFVRQQAPSKLETMKVQ